MNLCLVENCNYKYSAKGYCKKHYAMFKRTGSPYRTFLINKNKICKAPNCDSPACEKELCRAHYDRWRNHQSFEKQSPCKEKNGNWNGGTSEYLNHYLFKKNRLITLKRNPICKICEKRPTKIAHHKDGSKDNHKLNNLLAVCHKCHFATFHNNMHKKSIFRRLYGATLQELADKYSLSILTVYRRLQNKIPLIMPKYQRVKLGTINNYGLLKER